MPTESSRTTRKPGNLLYFFSLYILPKSGPADFVFLRLRFPFSYLYLSIEILSSFLILGSHRIRPIRHVLPKQPLPISILLHQTGFVNGFVRRPPQAPKPEVCNCRIGRNFLFDKRNRRGFRSQETTSGFYSLSILAMH